MVWTPWLAFRHPFSYVFNPSTPAKQFQNQSPVPSGKPTYQLGLWYFIFSLTISRQTLFPSVIKTGPTFPSPRMVVRSLQFVSSLWPPAYGLPALRSTLPPLPWAGIRVLSPLEGARGQTSPVEGAGGTLKEEGALLAISSAGRGMAGWVWGPAVWAAILQSGSGDNSAALSVQKPEPCAACVLRQACWVLALRVPPQDSVWPAHSGLWLPELILPCRPLCQPLHGSAQKACRPLAPSEVSAIRWVIIPSPKKPEPHLPFQVCLSLSTLPPPCSPGVSLYTKVSYSCVIVNSSFIGSSTALGALLLGKVSLIPRGMCPHLIKTAQLWHFGTKDNRMTNSDSGGDLCPWSWQLVSHPLPNPSLECSHGAWPWGHWLGIPPGGYPQLSYVAVRVCLMSLGQGASLWQTGLRTG